MTREEILKELTKLHDQELQHLRSLVIIRDKRNLLMSVDAEHGPKAEAAAEHREERKKAADEAMAKKTLDAMEDTVSYNKAGAERQTDGPETRDDGKAKCHACSKWFKDLEKHQKSCSYLKKLEEGPSEDEKELPDSSSEEVEEESTEESTEELVVDLPTLSKAFGQLAKTNKDRALEILHSYNVKSASQMTEKQRVAAYTELQEELS